MGFKKLEVPLQVAQAEEAAEVGFFQQSQLCMGEWKETLSIAWTALKN